MPNAIACFPMFLMLMMYGLDSEAGRKKIALSERLIDLVDESTIKAPVNHEVCFSPDERCDLKLVRFVEGAQSSIDIAAFDINLDQLVHRILVASKKAIRVRVMVDSRQSKGAYSLVGTLKKGGIEIRRGKQRGLMHHKFVIIDKKRIETGSFNYTNHASRANQENQIYLEDAQIVGRFLQRFERSWSEAKVWED